MTVAYDGTNYAGWQRQNNGLSIQQLLEDSLFELFGERVTVDASGRTDAGVHAVGQVAAMTLDYEISEERLILAINSKLPADVRVRTLHRCAESFHPQFQAKQKTYRYTYDNAPFPLPQHRLYAAPLHETLDLDAMRRALKTLEGEHDFAALCAVGSSAKTTVRTIYRTDVFRDASDENLVHLVVTGNGFLYNMVRIIAGTAADIGRHRLPEDIFTQAIATGDRTILGMTAPACGLCLMNVSYEEITETEGDQS